MEYKIYNTHLFYRHIMDSGLHEEYRVESSVWVLIVKVNSNYKSIELIFLISIQS